MRVDGSHYNFPASNFRLADRYRPDVGSAYPGYGNYHGFEFDVPVRSDTHSICVEAQNSGVYNVLSGCKTVVVTGSTDHGRFFGGLYEDTPFAGLTVQYTRGTTWADDIDTGANRWDAASNLNVDRTTNTGAREIAVVAYNFPSSHDHLYGRTRFPPWCASMTSACSGGALPWQDRTYTDNRVYLNTSHPDLDGSNDRALRRKVIAHEFGHALGLDHPPNPGVATVMAQGPLGGNTIESPSAWDLASIDHADK